MNQTTETDNCIVDFVKQTQNLIHLQHQHYVSLPFPEWQNKMCNMRYKDMVWLILERNCRITLLPVQKAAKKLIQL